MSKANTNCLAGLRCPACGSREPFTIEATSTFLVYDAGTEEHADVEWKDSSFCRCRVCGCAGTVAGFRIGSAAYRTAKKLQLFKIVKESVGT